MDEREQAIERVYRERYVGFRNALATVTGSYETARDAVQEAFALAVRERSSFRGDAPLEAWLWGIVLNAAATEQRRAGREAPADDLDRRRNGRVDQADDDVRIAVARLPERQRLVLFLRYYADLDYRTIAELLGIEVGTVSATLSAAHQNLRKRLREVTG